MLQFFIPPLAFVSPKLENIQDLPLQYESNLAGDDHSLPSLDSLSIGSDITDYTCDNISHVELCQLLGPKVGKDEDKHSLPNDLIKPTNLEHSMSLDLQVGFFRLRRAFLTDKNEFWNKNVLDQTLNYKSIVSHGWDRHEEVIGSPNLPSNIESKDIVGCTRKTEYLMPKNGLVKANMAYETAVITEYNEHCFAIEMHTSNPDVPFGKKFLAHTKIVVYNTGENTCRMECSVETEFPNGPPFGLAQQIKGAMKSGSFEVFEKIGEAIMICASSTN